MKRNAIYLASAALGAALVASSAASAAEVNCWYNGAMHRCIYYPGYAYEYPSGSGLGTIGAGLGAIAATPFELAGDVTQPLMTGRSVAVSPMAGTTGAGAGRYCATPEKTCRLHEPGWLGTGCSCKIPGGRAQGFVQ